MFSFDFCPTIESQRVERFVLEQKVIDALVDEGIDEMDAIYLVSEFTDAVQKDFKRKQMD